jgi:hypothetical protein
VRIIARHNDGLLVGDIPNRHGVDFDRRSKQLGDSEGGPRGRRFLEVLSVNAVHLVEVPDVLQVDLRVDDVVHGQACGLHDSLYVFERLSHLPGKRIRHRSIGSLGALAGDIDVIAGADTRRIRAYERGTRCRYDGPHLRAEQ